MRISPWLHLAALCVIVSSFSASVSPLSARRPVSEVKKPLIHEEFTGYGTTVLEAENNALQLGCEWLRKHGGLEWAPDSPYLREHKMVGFGEAEDKEFKDEPMLGTMKVVKMQLDVTAEQARDMQKQAQQQRMKERQKLSLSVLIGVMALLGVVGGYLRLEEATQGYYTRLLRIAAVGVLVVIVAGLYVVR